MHLKLMGTTKAMSTPLSINDTADIDLTCQSSCLFCRSRLHALTWQKTSSAFTQFHEAERCRHSCESASCYSSKDVA